MTSKLSSAFNYYNTAPFSTAGQLQSAATLVEKIFRPDLLELSCYAVIDSLSRKQAEFDALAKACIKENIVDLVRGLCAPLIPLSVAELITRTGHAFPVKLRPGDRILEEFRLIAVERGGLKRRNPPCLLPFEKLINNLRAVDGRIDMATASLFVQLIEHLLVILVQATLNYRSKITSQPGSSICVTDIQHIVSLLGASENASLVKSSLFFLRRHQSNYEGCLKDLQAFLKVSNDHLNVVIRIFFDPMAAILGDLARGYSSTKPITSMEQSLRTVSLIPVTRAASTALAVLTSAKSLANDLTILSEVADDVFDSTAHLLKYCLQEPAEEDLYQGFAYYAETIFAEDGNHWLSVISETPQTFLALFQRHRSMVRAILDQVSLRRAPDLELCFADPHVCNLCSEINDYLSHDLLSSSNSPHCHNTSVATSGEASTVPTPPHPDSHLPVSTQSTLGSFFRHHQRTAPFRKLSLATRLPSSSQHHRLSPQMLQEEDKSQTGGKNNQQKQQHPSWFQASGSPSPPLPPSSSSSAASLEGSPPALIPFPSNSTASPSSQHFQPPHLTEQRTGASYGGGSKTCSQMVIAFRYLVPRLLLMPIYQILYLADLVDELCMHTRKDKQEQSILCEVSSMLYKTRKSVTQGLFKSAVEDWTGMHLPKLSGLLETPLSGKPISHMPADDRTKLNEVIQLARSCSETAECHISVNDFIMSGIVHVRQNPSRTDVSDRLAYLFTDCLLLFKLHPQQRRGLSMVAMAAAALNPSTAIPSSATLSCSSAFCGVISLKKCIPLTHFHLIDLSMEVVSDTCANIFLFEVEYWKDVNITARPSQPDHPPSHLATSSLPKPNSSASLSTLTSQLSSQNPRLSGSSTTIENLYNTTSCPEEVEADSSAPAKRIIFALRSADEKADWLGTLIGLQTKRLFTRYIRELPKQEIPLVLPDPETYCFTKADTMNNIQFELLQTDSSAEIPVIKAATISKLIERMTYHAYFDSKTIRTFLQTYRRYISAQELLNLLIKRFNIPRPNFERELQATIKERKSFSDVASLIPRMELRFHSVYKRKVQYRVLSFITKWVRDVAYFKHDFSVDGILRDQLVAFIDTIKAPVLADSVASIYKCLHGDRIPVLHTINQVPQKPLCLGLVSRPDQIRLSNVHPLELARQVTLHEWELYSKIEFWEVKGKEKSSGPNVKRSLEFSNKFQWWLVLNIMSQESIEHRVLVMQRVADLLLIFEEMNNLQGAQEARAALLSSPVFRLYDTFDMLFAKSKAHHRCLFENLRLSETDVGSITPSDAYMVNYQRKVHCIDPPAVPFIAVGGKTQLIHLELKNADYLPQCSNSKKNLPSEENQEPGEIEPEEEQLINFYKCQQIAELVEHFLSFQNTPFNLEPDSIIQEFLLHLDPLGLANVADEATFEDLMYQRSLFLQPRESVSNNAGATTYSTTTSVPEFQQPPKPLHTVGFEAYSRPLTVAEQRIGNLLSATPISPLLYTADLKEFKQLLSIASTCHHSPIDPNQPHGLATISQTPPPSAPSLQLVGGRNRGGSLGRGYRESATSLTRHEMDITGPQYLRSTSSPGRRGSTTPFSLDVEGNSPALHTTLPPPLPPKPPVTAYSTDDEAPPLPPHNWTILERQEYAASCFPDHSLSPTAYLYNAEDFTNLSDLPDSLVSLELLADIPGASYGGSGCSITDRTGVGDVLDRQTYVVSAPPVCSIEDPRNPPPPPRPPRPSQNQQPNLIFRSVSAAATSTSIVNDVVFDAVKDVDASSPELPPRSYRQPLGVSQSDDSVAPPPLPPRGNSWLPPIPPKGPTVNLPSHE